MISRGTWEAIIIRYYIEAYVEGMELIFNAIGHSERCQKVMD